MNHYHARENNVKVAFFLNTFFAVVELIGGLLTNSLTIASDALHDLGDAITLAVAWFAEKGARKNPDSKRTFGYQRLSLAASIVTAIVLTSGSLFIFLQAIPRLINPEPVNARGMIGLAVLGVAVNGIAFLRLRKGMSLNEKVLTWHFIEDILGWAVILVGGIIIHFWNNYFIDPLMTIAYTSFIFWGVGKNLKEIINILLQGVPSHINIDELKKAVLEVEGVAAVHDVHVWSLEGETNIFTGHVVINKDLIKNRCETSAEIKNVLSKFHIQHSTLEFEDEPCLEGECNLRIPGC